MKVKRQNKREARKEEGRGRERQRERDTTHRRKYTHEKIETSKKENS